MTTQMPGGSRTQANHPQHTHVHGRGCGHDAVQHEGHIDYLHDGHLHHKTGGSAVEEHTISVSNANREDCTPGHACDAHEKGHQHGPGCGHATVPHGNHMDYVVAGHLHHPHGDHCDSHGDLRSA